MNSNDVLAVSIPEAARISGLGRTSIYKLFSTGQLVPRKAGKRTLILVSDITNYLQTLPKGKTHE